MPWVAALLAFALASFALTGFNGYHPTDDGLIYSWSWRILNGEVPYRDFIYIRTPFTLYVHTLWLGLPDGWQIPAGRLAYYIEMIGVVGLPIAWAVRTGRLHWNARTVALVVIGLAYAIHNFPPMPWYTVDGLLLGAVALTATLFSRTSTSLSSAILWRAAASAAVVLAMLCKQNFAVLPVILGVFAIVEATRTDAGRKWPMLLASALPGLAILVGAAAWLAAAGALPDAVKQLTATVPPGEPFFSAVFVYFRLPVTLAIVILVPAGLILGWSCASPAFGPLFRVTRQIAVPIVVAALVLLEAFALGLEATGWGAYRTGHAAFWGLAGVVGGSTAVYALRRVGDGETLLLHWGVLVLAWAGSISGGYASPILGLAPIGILLSLTLPSETIKWERPLLVGSVVAVLAIHLTLTLQYPYRDRPRSEQTADLGQIYPRFGRLLTNEPNYVRFAELARMIDELAIKSGRTFAVTPTYALIYFLTDRNNPVSVNTYSYIEYRGFEDRLASEFEDRRPITFLERDVPTPVGDRRHPPLPCEEWLDPSRSAIVGNRAMTWRLVAEGDAFCVYEHRQ